MDEKEKPRLGETVHYVALKDNEELGIAKGDEVPIIITKVHRSKKFNDRFEVTGVAITTEGFCEVVCYDDQECKLPGSWHRDEDCAEEGWDPEKEGQ